MISLRWPATSSLPGCRLSARLAALRSRRPLKEWPAAGYSNGHARDVARLRVGKHEVGRGELRRLARALHGQLLAELGYGIFRQRRGDDERPDRSWRDRVDKCWRPFVPRDEWGGARQAAGFDTLVSPLRALPIAHFCNKICQFLPWILDPIGRARVSSTLAWLHTLRLDHGCGFWCQKEFDERFRRGCLSHVDNNAGGEDKVCCVLQLSG
jgi:hypothetical protein